jgi:hypothetical protein
MPALLVSRIHWTRICAAALIGTVAIIQHAQAENTARSRWVVKKLSPQQVALTIRANDGRFAVAVGCMRQDGALAYSVDLYPLAKWRPDVTTTILVLDGKRMRWELIGSEDGYPISDGVVANRHAFSKAGRKALSEAERLVVRGRSQGRNDEAVFELSGGASRFAAFEIQCASLR